MYVGVFDVYVENDCILYLINNILMKFLKYFFFAAATTFFSCNSDTENSGNGTLREITEEADSSSAETEAPKTETETYIAAIHADKDFYAHFESSDNALAELSAFDREVFLILSLKNAPEPISLNGSFNDDMSFTVKGITQQDGKQIEYQGTVNEDYQLVLSKKSDQSNLEFFQDYEGGIPFKAYALSKEFDGEAGSLTDKIQVLLPAFTEEFSEFNRLLINLLFEKKEGRAQELLNMHHQKLLSDFKSDEMGGFWNRELNSEVLYNNKGYIAYGVHEFSYTGGAHGNGASSFILYDLIKQKQVALSDMFSKEDLEKLKELIYEQIKSERKLSDTEMRNEYNLPIKPNDNFYITPKGLHFFYNAYELSSYAMGPDAVFFSFEELNEGFKTGFFKNLAL